jgi:hypothetical protein
MGYSIKIKYIPLPFRYISNFPMNQYHCLICEKIITPKVYKDSLIYYTVPLCFPHRRMIDESKATLEAKKLYFALKSSQVPVVLEYKDGIKTIDIAWPGMLYIEVEGLFQDADQALTDLMRSIHSLKENIPTIRIPNSLILDEFRFPKAVSRIIDMCKDLKKAG